MLAIHGRKKLKDGYTFPFSLKIGLIARNASTFIQSFFVKVVTSNFILLMANIVK